MSVVGPNLGQGINDGLEMACLLMGELVVRAYYEPETEQLTCTVPARPDNLESFRISVEIRLNDVPRAFTEDLAVFRYYREPTPISMEPIIAPRWGGMNLYIAGVLFFDHPDLRCRFGQDGPVVQGMINATLNVLVCRIAPQVRGGASKVIVQVSQNAQQFVDFTEEFMFLDYYGINLVSPIAGPLSVAGSQRTLTITGQNLKNYDETGTRPDVLCVFHVATGAVVVGNHSEYVFSIRLQSALSFSEIGQKVLCTEPLIPGMLTGPLFIDVDMGQLPLGEANSVQTRDELMYSYYSPLASTAQVYPAVGLEAGGSVLEVRGSLFSPTPAIVCTFSNELSAASGPGSFVHSSLILCQSPSFRVPRTPAEGLSFSRELGVHAAVTLRVSLDAATSFLPADGSRFTYLLSPSLRRVHPFKLPYTAELARWPVTVQGANFANIAELSCKTLTKGTYAPAPCSIFDSCPVNSSRFCMLVCARVQLNTRECAIYEKISRARGEEIFSSSMSCL